MIRIEHILAPTDFSEASGKALKYACAFADQYGAAVHLLHVSSIPSLRSSEFGMSEMGMYLEPSPDLEPQIREQAEHQMSALEEEWSDYAFPVHREVVFGNPFLEIIQYARAKDIDMIILGTHGRGAIAQMLLGSVAEKVVRKAPCPVLTVRDEEHEFIMP